MIDVHEAIDAMRSRSLNEAYWRALEKVMGTMTARTLRTTLRVRVRGEGLSERDRVAKGLSELFSYQARTVEELARQEAADCGLRPREDALQELESHSHWVDFADTGNEARRAMAFVKRGIARGAKVVALLPSGDLEAYRGAVAESGCQEDLDTGRLTLFNVDNHLDVLKTAGALAVLLLAVQGMIQAAKGQGYSEVWFVSKVVSSLLATSAQYMDLALRVDLALDGLTRTLPMSLYCPMPEQFPGQPAMMTGFLAHHGWASLADSALASLQS